MSKLQAEKSGPADPEPPGDRAAGEPAPPLDVTTLMQGRREVVILHGDERYRLRITSNDRLILTK